MSLLMNNTAEAEISLVNQYSVQNLVTDKSDSRLYTVPAGVFH
jgi:hypothetical protein